MLPTLLLCITGGWLMKPPTSNLFLSTDFLISTITTIFIMSSSMIINDIYDMEIDKINHPERPLVTGEITVPEAIILFLSLLGLTEFLSFTFLPFEMQTIVHLAILFVSVYTKFFKPVVLLKNISCASLVSFSIFFSGLASSNQIMSLHKNFGLFSIVLNLIFFGSFYNELLLDMRDYEGDKKNHILTIPVLFGMNISYTLAKWLLYFIMFITTMSLPFAVPKMMFSLHLSKMFIISMIIPFLITFKPLFIDLLKIHEKKYEKDQITFAIRNTVKPLFFMLIYVLVLSFFT